VRSRPDTRPSRRAVLAGGLGLAAVAACGAGGYELVQNGTLPGRYQLARLTGACELTPVPPAGPLPSRHQVSFHSAYRRRDVQMVTLVPAAAASPAGLGVVIALHGSGGSPATLAPVLARAMSSARVTRFAIICVDGGETYWHKRADGDDPAGMIVHEVLPRAADAGMRTGRIGVVGLSMGGYGALLIAEQFSAEQPSTFQFRTRRHGMEQLSSAGRPGSGPAVAAVAALSPAVFASYDDARAANPGAFDSAADFTRNDVLTGLFTLRRVPAFVACGTDDPFQPEVTLVRSRLAALTRRPVPGGIMPGCHDSSFWARHWPAALEFVGARHSTGF
jgi:pimeloyl-ACP methyl ester carboxylesterase